MPARERAEGGSASPCWSVRGCVSAAAGVAAAVGRSLPVRPTRASSTPPAARTASSTSTGAGFGLPVRIVTAPRQSAPTSAEVAAGVFARKAAWSCGPDGRGE